MRRRSERRKVLEPAGPTWGNRLSRTLTGLALVTLLPGLVRAFPALWPSRAEWFWPVGIGVVLGAVGDLAVLRRTPGLQVLEHEVTHLLAGLLCFRLPVGFTATEHGGAVRHVGVFVPLLNTVIGDFIGLAPYVVPTFTVAAVLSRPLVGGPGWLFGLDLCIGLTLGLHTGSTIRETVVGFTTRVFRDALNGRPTRSDIAERGFVYSALYIVAGALAVHGMLLGVLVRGYAQQFPCGGAGCGPFL